MTQSLTSQTRQQRRASERLKTPQYNVKQKPTERQITLALGLEKSEQGTEEDVAAKRVYFNWLPRSTRREILRARLRKTTP